MAPAVDWREALGWTATAVFAGSYFLSGPHALRRVQMAGALLWLVYGLLISATPVVAANALVFVAAAWTDVRVRRGRRQAAELRAVTSR